MALHILVVDDDADVLTMIVETLRVSGFIVTAADSGVAMREILADKALLPIDAVVLDCTMPGEPSAKLALHAKSLRLPVVMVSGSIESMKLAEEHGLHPPDDPAGAVSVLFGLDLLQRQSVIWCDKLT